MLLDWSAAFDTINSSILFNILEYCLGISDIAFNWLKCYLYARIQSIVAWFSEP